MPILLFSGVDSLQLSRFLVWWWRPWRAAWALWASLAVVACLHGAAWAQAGSALNPAWRGIARIDVASVLPNEREPWQAGREERGSGTGWLVGKNRFLTNAHVVRHAQRITLRLPHVATPLFARVAFRADDADLALLELSDPADAAVRAAMAGVQPLPIGSMPRLNSDVLVVGYPLGGQNLSVTRGVVSRIEQNLYAHSSIDAHLSIQVDAAINPGNSGGPVLQNGKVVGVAFQALAAGTAQNVGYIIPVPVIARFLHDIADGRYDHYVDMAMEYFPLENPAQRLALQLPPSGPGVMISTVWPGGSAHGVLQAGDVLLAVDELPVRNDGMLQIGNEWLELTEIAERRFAGEVVRLKVWRAGRALDLHMTLKRYHGLLAQGNNWDGNNYFVLYAGMLFQPLNRNVARAWNVNTPDVRYLLGQQYKESAQVDAVLLSTFLPDASNTFLGGYAPAVVHSINGVAIQQLTDIAAALAATAPEHPDFLVLRLLGQERPIVLPRAQAAAIHQAVLARYDIARDRHLP